MGLTMSMITVVPDEIENSVTVANLLNNLNEKPEIIEDQK